VKPGEPEVLQQQSLKKMRLSQNCGLGKDAAEKRRSQKQLRFGERLR
jgi:hypothetical protein